jgi:crossover junction endodeoxyribonuclease RuvC
MLVVGIDPALNSTGWGAVKKEKGKLIYIASGVISPSVSATVFEKLLFISKAVQEVLTEFIPTLLAIEETFVNCNPQTSLRLGLVRGGIILTAIQNGFEVEEISPALVKKMITGNGRAEKPQIAFMISKILSGAPKTFKTYDETDALAIACTKCL